LQTKQFTETLEFSLYFQQAWGNKGYRETVAEVGQDNRLVIRIANFILILIILLKSASRTHVEETIEALFDA